MWRYIRYPIYYAGKHIILLRREKKNERKTVLLVRGAIRHGMTGTENINIKFKFTYKKHTDARARYPYENVY